MNCKPNGNRWQTWRSRLWFIGDPYAIDHATIRPIFLETLPKWLLANPQLLLRGLDAFPQRDVCIGVTQFIDELHLRYGEVQVLHGDYAYHQRLNPRIDWRSIDQLEPERPLILGMPMPYYGDKHPDMDAILARCLEWHIPVHIDAAWLAPAKDISFDFDHPAIESWAISLSKPLCLGTQRIGMRFARQRPRGPISLMNDYTMVPTSLMMLGVRCMEQFGGDYLWNKYGDANAQICRDFDLIPTATVYLAIKPDGTRVGLRALLRYLADR